MDTSSNVNIGTPTTILLFIYIICYSLFTSVVMISGWIDNFSFLFSMLPVSDGFKPQASIVLGFNCILGAILGGAVLNITSFHRYIAIEKKFDTAHIWGFFFTPLLSLIVGILTFCFLQSGLLILNGSQISTNVNLTSSLGFTAMGAIAGYNWDVFIDKMKNLSKNLNEE